MQNVASLDQLFYIGKLVRCRIVSITRKGFKKIVSLTVNPNDVNKDVKQLKSGMVSCNRVVSLSLYSLVVSGLSAKTGKKKSLVIRHHYTQNI